MDITAPIDLIEKIVQGKKTDCRKCSNGYYVPYNASVENAHSFYCSNPKCSDCIIIDLIINIE